jgi:peroxiredoxin
MRFALLALSGCVASLHVTDRAKANDEAAAFSLPAQDGRRVDLASELAHGPVVLVFYRGFW